MANQGHLDILKRGVEEWNDWRVANPEASPDLSKANLSKMDLRDADLTRADLTRADLTEAQLRGANLWRANLQETNLTGAYIQRADLRGAQFGRAQLGGAHLSGAQLGGAQLGGAQLTLAHLRETDLREAYLREAHLREAQLQRADLREADLTGTDLREADLTGARFQQADLREADLTGTDLRGADLSEAHLGGADLHEATLGGTIFGNIDLSAVNGLEWVVHRGPSTIGIDTLYRSGGNIPVAFLRGCGVPDTFIEYLPSLIGAQDLIQYYSCFISYSSQDEALAKRLYADLQANHVRVWFAPEDLKIGDRIRIGIDESIRVYDKLLLILSKHSLASQWVEQEVETALAKERAAAHAVLFPIRLDDEVMDIASGWPALIRNTRHIGDFRHWKEHDAFESAFARLLRDLRAAERTPPARGQQ